MLHQEHPDLSVSLRAIMSSRPGLLHRVMSGSVTLQQTGPESMSRDPAVPEDHEDDWGLSATLGQISFQGPCHTWGHVVLVSPPGAMKT